MDSANRMATLSVKYLADRMAALTAHLDGDLEASRPEGLTDNEWAALKVIVRTGRAYATPRTWARLRDALREITYRSSLIESTGNQRGYVAFAETPPPPLLGWIEIVVDTQSGLADGYIYPDQVEALRLAELRVRSDVLLQR